MLLALGLSSLSFSKQQTSFCIDKVNHQKELSKLLEISLQEKNQFLAELGPLTVKIHSSFFTDFNAPPLETAPLIEINKKVEELSLEDLRERALTAASLYVGNSFEIFIKSLEIAKKCDYESQSLTDVPPSNFIYSELFNPNLAVSIEHQFNWLRNTPQLGFNKFFDIYLRNINYVDLRIEPYLRSRLDNYDYIRFVANRLNVVSWNSDLYGADNPQYTLYYSPLEDLTLHKRELEKALKKIETSPFSKQLKSTALTIRLRLEETNRVIDAYSTEYGF